MKFSRLNHAVATVELIVVGAPATVFLGAFAFFGFFTLLPAAILPSPIWVNAFPVWLASMAGGAGIVAYWCAVAHQRGWHNFQKSGLLFVRLCLSAGCAAGVYVLATTMLEGPYLLCAGAATLAGIHQLLSLKPMAQVVSMSAFKTFEIEAIRLMGKGQLSDEQLEALQSCAGAVEYEYTGCGYFLRVRADWLPERTCTLSEPAVVGKANEIVCGFVLLLRPNELELECHTWGSTDVPFDFRSRQVVISTPPIHMLGSKDGANDRPET